jgi:hypothetical protein
LADSLRQAHARPDLPAMGARSLEIIQRWDFGADVRGLHLALDKVCPARARPEPREHFA